MLPTLHPTTPADLETLLDIRLAAMRESLERIGRFDPQRARERLIASYDPATCEFIVADGIRVGFLQMQPQQNHWYLAHFYIVPEHQGQGIGAAILDILFARADAQAMPIKLAALRGSDSNRFYQRHGFEPVEESEWDIYYIRQPKSSSRAS
jgi:GNAT superfamily N-acetyltransferase